MAISHAGHNHPATPAARAACRKSTGNPNVTRIESDGSTNRKPFPAPRVAVSAWNFGIGADEMAARSARKPVEKPARIQPRRSGARVSARNTSCVQAALHIDAHGGRCACGWTADVAA